MDRLALIAQQPELAALFLDVDGTLAPIVDDPATARVPAVTQNELRRLAGRYGLVACVSGRPGSVALEIVGVPELTYVGEHGLELEPQALEWAEAIHDFADRAPWPSEEKPLTAAFHYRSAPVHSDARAALEEVAAEAQREGFRIRWGRLVLEVLPPVEASKGTAVRRLLEAHELQRALYAGDDTTDLDGFAALDGLELAVRIAVSSREGPAALAERADIVVESPEGLAAILAEL